MSKLINMYENFKKQEPDFIYLFKSGIFYLFLDKDAETVSPILNLKLTNLNQSTCKCGFPCSSYNKYSILFKKHNLKIKIIEADNNIIYNLKNYNENMIIKKLLESIKSINPNNLSISEAYNFIEFLKEEVNKLEKGDID